jgi:hypothetical protein
MGFAAATAKEIRVKMKSRQLFSMHTTDPNASFDLDAVESVCKKINMEAYKWGLGRVSEKARDRFETYRVPMVFEEDTFPLLPMGPLWINDALDLTEKTVKDGLFGKERYVLSVKSTSFKTSQDGWETKLYPDSNGYDYCKLLSPARVVEWIHTDGLRRGMGYNSK